MYKFISKHLGLNIDAITRKDGKIDESGITIQPNKELLVFGSDHVLPKNALRSHKDVERVFKEVQGK